MVHIKTNTSKFKYVNNTNVIRRNNVAKKYQGIASVALIKPTAYRKVANGCWYVYHFLMKHEPMASQSTNYYKRRI